MRVFTRDTETPLALTFDDVALVPCYNNIQSRLEPDLSTWLTRKLKVAMPLIPANMDTVIGEDLARVIHKCGGIPIFHRFASLETMEKWAQEFQGRIILSCGLVGDAELRRLISFRPLGICIDIAHGHSERVIQQIREIKEIDPEIQVIAGNVCTPRAYNDLVNAGADAVKVGVGPGAACSTRVVTGFGIPQFSAILSCAAEAAYLRVPIIADGGIRGSADVVKALAAGASTVMIGKLFALTHDSAAPKREEETPEGKRRILAKYRGHASSDFQTEFYGQVKPMTVPEGVHFWAPVEKTAEQLIHELLAGIRSGLTYAGARSIKELQRKARFVQVSPGYLQESHPRPQP